MGVLFDYNSRGPYQSIILICFSLSSWNQWTNPFFSFMRLIYYLGEILRHYQNILLAFMYRIYFLHVSFLITYALLYNIRIFGGFYIFPVNISLQFFVIVHQNKNGISIHSFRLEMSTTTFL